MTRTFELMNIIGTYQDTEKKGLKMQQNEILLPTFYEDLSLFA